MWALNLLLFYTHVGGHAVGEQWSSPGSWIQLAGFCVLLLGTITYAQVWLAPTPTPTPVSFQKFPVTSMEAHLNLLCPELLLQLPYRLPVP